MPQLIIGQGGHLVFLIGPKTRTCQRTLRSCFLSSFVEYTQIEPGLTSKCIQVLSVCMYVCMQVVLCYYIFQKMFE